MTKGVVHVSLIVQFQLQCFSVHVPLGGFIGPHYHVLRLSSEHYDADFPGSSW